MKSRIQYIITAFLMMASPYAAFAQRTVQGSVKDEKGEPVVGAVVVIEGKSTGSVTDASGRYHITLPDSSKGGSPVLKCTCLGFVDKKISVGSRSVIDFVLEEDSQQLEEVVVVGYGAMRRSDLTGAVTSVRIDENEVTHNTSLDQMLKGHAAGVEVISNSAAPDAGVSIRIRGITTLSGTNEPLYVVDGVIMSDPTNAQVLEGEYEEATNGLAGLNPQDIASIEILKDASSTAIYGAAGANGVVLITTKQSSKSKPVIQVNTGVDLVTPYNRMDVLGFDEYVDLLYMKKSDSDIAYLISYMYSDPVNRTGLKVTPVNWQERYINPTVRQRYFASVSGSPRDLKYSFSVGYNSEPGVVAKTGMEQYTLRLNVDKSFLKKLTVGTKVNVAYVSSKSQQGTGSDGSQASSSLIKSLVCYRPFITADNEALEYLDETELANDEKSSPDAWFTDAYATRKEYRISPSIYARYNFTGKLYFRSAIGGDTRFSERTKWKGGIVDRNNGSGGGASYAESARWNWDNTLNYMGSFGKNHLTMVAGMTMGRSSSVTSTVQALNVVQYKGKGENINSSAGSTDYFYNETQNSQLSWFARGVYSYDDRYVLTATARVDGSSQFRGSNRYSFFPSAAFAWRINKEKWFHIPAVSMLKLRLGWGVVGNSSLSAYQTFNGFGFGNYGNHFTESASSITVSPSNFSNEDLKWETTRQVNTGLDMGLWQGRFTLTADAYYKTTYDLLQLRNIPRSSGFNQRWVNEGTIVNRGLEFSVETVPVRTRDVEWSLRGNISFNRNLLQDLGYAADPTDIYLEPGCKSTLKYYLGDKLGSSYVSDPANIFIQGYPVGLLYGYRTDGIVQKGETGPGLEPGKTLGPGDVMYIDMDGNGYIDSNDRTVIGDTNAKFSYGFSTTFSFGRLSLSAVFDGVYGNRILNANMGQYTDMANQYGENVLATVFHNRWTEDNPSEIYHAADKYGGNRSYVLDSYVQDGSYLRLSLLSLNYDFRISNRRILKNLGVGLSVSNVFVATKYSGWSPMVSSFGNSMRRIGIDYSGYPLNRSYAFDLKFTF